MRETFEANRQGRVASHGSRITFHESRFTITVHESRFTNHGSRITVHESRFTHHESRITLPLHKAVPVVHNQKRTRRCYLASTLIPMEDTMAQVIPENYLDLFQKKAFAHLATINEDGTPQVTPVWIDYDGNHVLVNSARGRRKDKNMERNSAVALSIQDPDNPYRYLEVRGHVDEITEQDARNHIDKMAKKYIGQDKYPWSKPDEVRVLYKITPERISHMG